jgi:ribosomal protein L25 (general stress protein Ctc)
MSDKTDITIEATVRTRSGKSYTHALRRAGRIPAVLNHKGQSTLLELDPKLLSKAWRDNGRVFHLAVEGSSKKVRITELQLDPVKRLALHVDLAPVE